MMTIAIIEHSLYILSKEVMSKKLVNYEYLC